MKDLFQLFFTFLDNSHFALLNIVQEENKVKIHTFLLTFHPFNQKVWEQSLSSL